MQPLKSITFSQQITAQVNPNAVHKKNHTGYLVEICGLQVQHNRSVEDATPQLKQWVEGDGGDVGLGPAVASFFHVLLKLDPPAQQNGI